MRRFLRALLKPGDDGLFSRAMSAGFWAVALRAVLRVATVVRTVILARLLSPDDFGLMAVATLSILLLERFTRGGFDSALVQRSDDIKPFLDTAWTLQIVVGLGTAAVLFVSAPWIAMFFDAPEAELVIRALSLAVVMKGFVNVGIVHFVKDLRFDRYFLFELTDRGADIVVSIGAALILRNVWALVLGVLASALARLIASYVLHEFRPRLRWVWTQVKQLFHFGKWILASNILTYGTGNIDDILVGRMLGVDALGLYRMAYNFSQAVATEVTQVTNQVAFPTYSMLQNASARLKRAYMGSLHLVSFIGFPLAVGTILVASEFTIGVLGQKWAPIVVPLQLLAVAGLMRGLGATIGPLFQSQGRPDIPPRFSIAKLAFLAIALYPAITRWGIEGAAGTIVIGGILTGIPALTFGIRLVRGSRADIVQAIGYPVLNTCVMVPFVLGTDLIFSGDTAIAFLILGVVGVASYGLAVLVTVRWLGYHAPEHLIDRIKRSTA